MESREIDLQKAFGRFKVTLLSHGPSPQSGLGARHLGRQLQQIEHRPVERSPGNMHSTKQLLIQ